MPDSTHVFTRNQVTFALIISAPFKLPYQRVSFIGNNSIDGITLPTALYLGVFYLCGSYKISKPVLSDVLNMTRERMWKDKSAISVLAGLLYIDSAELHSGAILTCSDPWGSTDN